MNILFNVSILLKPNYYLDIVITSIIIISLFLYIIYSEVSKILKDK